MQLTRSSKARMLLLAKFRSGEINGTEKPKAVHSSDTEFQKFSLANFRAFYNRMKKEISTTAPITGDADWNRKCRLSAFSPGPASKKRRTLEEDDETANDDNLSEEGDEIIPRSSGGFMPLTLIAEWFEPKTMTKRLTVCINLPSGVSNTGFAVRVLDGGLVLELTVTWPIPMTSVDVLHRKWTAPPKEREDFMSDYHPEILRFGQALKKVRGHSHDTVQSVTKISLPFAVETHIVSQCALGLRDNAMRAVYIRLKALAEDYAVQNNSSEFEIV